jgi:hypothetical protein
MGYLENHIDAQNCAQLIHLASLQHEIDSEAKWKNINKLCWSYFDSHCTSIVQQNEPLFGAYSVELVVEVYILLLGVETIKIRI